MKSILRNIVNLFLFTIAASAVRGATIPTIAELAMSPNSTVVAGTIVTLTASVRDPGMVTKGTVLFCNATIQSCNPGNGLYGAAQLISSGTASIRTRFGVGINNIQAVFVPTTTHEGSVSPTTTLDVSADPIYSSNTTVLSMGSAANYDLTGTVTAFGTQTLTGTVSLLDISNGDIEIHASSLGNPSWTLGPVATTLPTVGPSGLAVSTVVGDFNGDGKPDLATVNDDDNGLVAVLLGNGDGSFRPPISYTVGVDPIFVTVGDFNGDGNLDLVTANSIGNSVSVLLGNGNGTFQSPIAIGTGIAPDSIAVGDFNSDGNLDLAVSNFNSDNISILLGHGDGTFDPQSAYPVGSQPTSIKVGDFNGDGNLDIVTSNGGSDDLSILFGNGDGMFRTQTIYATDSYPTQVSVADLNHDGIADLITVNLHGNDVSVLIGNGDGTFQTQALYATGSLPAALAVADFDGDGNLDIVTANATGGGELSLLLAAGRGVFKTALEFAANSGPDGPVSLTVEDLNGDGAPDLASGCGTSVRIFLGEQIATYDFSGVHLPFTGAQNVQASYSGDASRSGSQSNIISLLGLVASTVTLTSSQPSLIVGQSELLTAKVSAGASGFVAFAAGNVPLGTVSIDSTGAAVLPTQFVGLPPSTYIITASYLGDSNFAPSSTFITQTVSLASSAVLLSSSSNPLTFGNFVTFTASIASGATGTITFIDGATVIGTKTVNAGIATISINSLSVGSHAIRAEYNGDSYYGGAISQLVSQTVNKSPANMTLVSSADPSVYGTNVTVTATISPKATGTVTLTDGTNILGIETLDASGKASFSIASLSAGTHSITATYSGDSNYY